MKESGSAVGSIILAGMFTAAKIENLINWSWWWVLAPIWIPWFLIPFGIFIFVVGYVVLEILTGNKK